MRRWENVDFFFIANDFTSQRIEGHNLFDFIAEHLDANREFFVHRDDFHGISANPESSAFECHVVAFVLHINKLAKQSIALYFIPNFEANHSVYIFLRST